MRWHTQSLRAVAILLTVATLTTIDVPPIVVFNPPSHTVACSSGYRPEKAQRTAVGHPTLFGRRTGQRMSAID